MVAAMRSFSSNSPVDLSCRNVSRPVLRPCERMYMINSTSARETNISTRVKPCRRMGEPSGVRLFIDVAPPQPGQFLFQLLHPLFGSRPQALPRHGVEEGQVSAFEPKGNAELLAH